MTWDILNLLDYLTNPNVPHWSKSLVENIEWFCIKPDTFMCQFTPDYKNCQSFLTEYGGDLGSLMDICSSIAVTTASDGQAWDTHGITTHISTQFYRPLVINTPIVISSKIVTINNESAKVKTRIYNLDDPEIQYALGIHRHVYIRNAKL
ncbi:hypothetical protein CLU79DRAFT_240831 [Phycomyces nitens]|nr:hypothetical protein CLU79DRAFT_240831 [Phycomyces nitens]